MRCGTALDRESALPALSAPRCVRELGPRQSAGSRSQDPLLMPPQYRPWSHAPYSAWLLRCAPCARSARVPAPAWAPAPVPARMLLLLGSGLGVAGGALLRLGQLRTRRGGAGEAGPDKVDPRSPVKAASPSQLSPALPQPCPAAHTTATRSSTPGGGAPPGTQQRCAAARVIPEMGGLGGGGGPSCALLCAASPTPTQRRTRRGG